MKFPGHEADPEQHPCGDNGLPHWNEICDTCEQVCGSYMNTTKDSKVVAAFRCCGCGATWWSPFDE